MAMFFATAILNSKGKEPLHIFQASASKETVKNYADEAMFASIDESKRSHSDSKAKSGRSSRGIIKGNMRRTTTGTIHGTQRGTTRDARYERCSGPP